MTQWEIDDFIEKSFFPMLIGFVIFCVVGILLNDKTKKNKGV